MREIVFDTETTGLDPFNGDKIVEIGMVELIDYLPSGNVFHTYINPLRDMPIEAFRVHGLSSQFLSDFPTFGDPKVCDAMLEFMGDARLIAHNAEFDRKFINAELSNIGLPAIPIERVTDTLQLAKKKFPGAPVSLDALCRRFGIDLKDRTLHGALLDARLLADVYLELMGGRERSFGFEPQGHNNNIESDTGLSAQKIEKIGIRPKKLAPRISAEEAKNHEIFILSLGENAFWLKN